MTAGDALPPKAAGEAVGTGAVAGAEPGRWRWKFGRAVLDESRLELRVDDVVVELEPKPLELLMFLLRRVDEVVTREEILEALWPRRVVTEGVITNCVAKLRTALRDSEQSVIRTVPRFGYRFTAKVEAQSLAAEEPPRNTLALVPGDPLPLRPHWTLRRQLSAGAHGELWLAARDKSGEQRVVKFARSPAGLSALKREITLYRVLAETLGDTQQFVPLLDWNVEEPPYFLETTYFEGGNLADWCAARGGLANLSVPLRLNLAAQCAAAVAAAHSAGVLHKDLKPANILVAADADGQPSLRLCDFAGGNVLDPARLADLGITRLGFTITDAGGEAAGSLLYMAPEVVAGSPATALADVYALGVLLFQLVVADFRRAPSPGWEADVPDPLLREDIALAAAGDVQRRLGDAGQLALRLRSLPARRAEHRVQQQRAAQAEMLQQALLRTRARRGLLLALVATFALGSVLATWLYFQARAARDEAVHQATLARTIQAFLTDDLLAAANPLAANGSNLRVRDLLDVSVATLDQRFPQPSQTKAVLQRTIGTAYGGLGEIAKAEPLLLAAEQTFARLLGPAALDTQNTRLALRDSYRISLQLAKVAAVAQRIVEAEEKAGKPHLDIWYSGMSGVLYQRCVARSGALWLADCGAPVLELAERARRDLGPHHPVTGRLLWIAGVSTVLSEHPRAAEPVLREALGVLSETLPPNSAPLAEVRLYWATSLRAIGEVAQARAMLERAIETFAGSVGRAQGFSLTATAYLGRCLADQGDLAGAVERMADSYRRRVQTYGPANAGTVIGLPSFVFTLLDPRVGQAEQALALLQDLEAKIAAAGGQGPASLEALWVRVLKADALVATGRRAEAERVLEANVAEARRRLTDGQWLLPYTEAQQGAWRVRQGDAARGLPQYRQAIAALQKTREPADPSLRHALELLPRGDGGSAPVTGNAGAT